jgi:transcription termination factor NusB
VLQNASLCDFYIDSYSSMKSGRLEPQLRDILRLGICQLVLMDRIPQSAAVSESVELAKSAGLGRAAGLVNAVLPAPRNLFLKSPAGEALPSFPSATASRSGSASV